MNSLFKFLLFIYIGQPGLQPLQVPAISVSPAPAPSPVPIIITPAPRPELEPTPVPEHVPTPRPQTAEPPIPQIVEPVVEDPARVLRGNLLSQIHSHFDDEASFKTKIKNEK